jgi:hypothetical protein
VASGPLFTALPSSIIGIDNTATLPQRQVGSCCIFELGPPSLKSRTFKEDKADTCKSDFDPISGHPPYPCHPGS